MKLFNTLGRSVQELTPQDSKQVTMYSCGLTVYSQPHIGNWVAYIYWDLLQRTLQESGFTVTRVQNITDVGHLTDDGDAGEDKMQKSALKEDKSAWEVADKYIRIAEDEAYQLLHLIRPTHMPRATDYIEQQIDFLKTLESGGYTYTLDDGVYYDTSKFSEYGTMARLDIDGLEFGARVADSGKKNPTDFALWKFSPKNEKRDMEWDSPWGKGFPGWHLECSVMAREILGDSIDIHTGGIDHIPVHHTNEIAQTEAVTEKQFSSMWIHANHIKVDGKKMSKSLGNIITLGDITSKHYSIDAFKLLVLSKHYRTEGNFTWEIMDATASRLQRWRSTAALRHQLHDTLANDDDKDATHDINGQILATPHAMLENLQNDLNAPQAIAQLESVLDAIESQPIEKLQKSALTQLLKAVDAMFGLHLIESTPDIADEAKQLIIKRNRAREDRDWQLSDELRDEIETTYDITLLDKTRTTTWRYSS